MSFKCDRCSSEVETFGVSYGMALDFREDQPDHPPQAEHENGHLCLKCRADFRDFMRYDPKHGR